MTREKYREFRLCYPPALEASTTLDGVLTVSFVIAADGSVASAETVHSTLDHEEMETCVCERILRWRFPEPEGGVSVAVTHPFVFYVPGRGAGGPVTPAGERAKKRGCRKREKPNKPGRSATQ